MKTKKHQTDRSKEPARVLAISRAGVTTSKHFAQFMSALMSDVVEGRMAPQVANAACNAGGKLLKAVELEHKYGAKLPDKTTEPLRLS